MMTYFLSTAFVLGFLIFVHELGHFLVAKWVGVKVQTFSIGFGTRLFGFKRGDTDYRISMIPLGGYVKMAGELPDDEVTGAPDEFNSRTVPERMAVILAGPFMNLAWAVIFLTIYFYGGRQTPAFLEEKPVVAWVDPLSSAADFGLEQGDEIIAVSNHETEKWQDVRDAMIELDEQKTFDVHVLRRNRQESVQIVLPDSVKGPQIGYWDGFANAPPYIQQILDDGAAKAAGLEPGDVIVSIDGQPMLNFHQCIGIIKANPENALLVEVLREGRELELSITPRLTEDGTGLIGAVIPPIGRSFTFTESVSKSVDENLKFAGLIFGYIGRIFAGEESGDKIGGPIMIAQVAGTAAQLGWDVLIYFMGVLSLQLGLLNLLPIPVLDGGHMVILTIEGVSGRPVSVKSRGVAQAVGLVILLGIMGFAFFNDITRWIAG